MRRLPSTACHAAVALCLLAASGCGRPTSEPPSTVTIETVPPAGAGGSTRTVPIGGRVRGHRPGDRIVVYARSGVWWVQPLAAQPFTDIDSAGRWQTTSHLGSEYGVLVVDRGHRAPATLDGLPQVGGTVRAVGSSHGTGDYVDAPRRTVVFSGHEWEVREASSDRGGANFYDARNVSVDTEGRLHLRIEPRDGRLTGAEVSLTRGLGFGTYEFTVADTAHLPPSAVFGLLTWDDGASQENHRELDVEISRWGDPANDNGQYVVQPYYIPANVRRFNAPAGRLTHAFRWEPGMVVFRTTRPGAVDGGPPLATHSFTTGVPMPGGERVRIHLYPFAYSTTPVAAPVEVVVEKFQHLP
ncbi:MAG TPA: hypothetical protein VMF13_06395 [Luteitalea sp.]|nr:hypothetical protein [Luteitalea sp.]